MTTSKKLTLPACLAVGLLTPACALLGVEPDEIDLADEGTGTTGLSTNTGVGEETDGNGGSDTGEDPTSTGEDASTGQDTGDGDGDPGDGDGDGDGDATGDGDGDPGDGDGDGDGDPGLSCEMFEPIPVELGENSVDVLEGPSVFEGSCGAPGPDAVFSFTAPESGSYEFTLATDEFAGFIYLVAGDCDPLEELACKSEGESIVHDMVEGEVVYVIVDSDAAPGTATLTIAAI